MSFILEGQSGEDIQVNAWNWRATLELLHNAGLINNETYELMGANGCGGCVGSETACRIADFVSGKLKSMRPGERVRADLTVTDKPKVPVVVTPSTKTSEIDTNELYSATYEWLVEFADFARRSGGFIVH